jgi:hypothetical protein
MGLFGVVQEKKDATKQDAYRGLAIETIHLD